MTVFNADVFRAWWNSLTADEQQPYKDKARWEHMSIPAVVREWWNETWQAIDCETGAAPSPPTEETP